METFSNKTPLLNWDHLKYILFCSKGRLNRRRYWLTSLLMALISGIVIGVLASMTHVEPGEQNLSVSDISVLALIFAYYIVITYISVVMLIKRAHDRNRSGHFLWLLFIPIVNLWPTIELYFIKGTEGANKFGEDPLK